MLIWLQVVCIVGVVLLLTPLIAWADNRHRARAQRLYESWRCPKCAEVFGPQAQQRGWGIKRDPYVPGAPMGGPILHCSHCDADFAFDGEGRQVDDHRKYVTPAS